METLLPSVFLADRKWRVPSQPFWLVLLGNIILERISLKLVKHFTRTGYVINTYKSINIFIFSCDSLVIITSIFMFSFTVFRHTGTYIFTYYYLHVYPYAVTIVYPIALCCQTGSAYLTLAVTLERYVAVCWSLKARHLCTQVRNSIFKEFLFWLWLLYNIDILI